MSMLRIESCVSYQLFDILLHTAFLLFGLLFCYFPSLLLLNKLACQVARWLHRIFLNFKLLLLCFSLERHIMLLLWHIMILSYRLLRNFLLFCTTKQQHTPTHRAINEQKELIQNYKDFIKLIFFI